MGLSFKHDRNQLTPKRVLLIAGLGLWLMFVLLGNSQKSDSTEDTTQIELVQPVESGEALAGRREQSAAWDRLDFKLADLAQNDPFARLDEDPPDVAAVVSDKPKVSQTEADRTKLAEADADRAAAADRAAVAKQRAYEEQVRRFREQQLENRLAAIRNQGIDAVYQSAGKVTAIIGKRTIHEGDLLEDGIRVVRISTNGLMLSVKATSDLPDSGPQAPESNANDDQQHLFDQPELP